MIGSKSFWTCTRGVGSLLSEGKAEFSSSGIPENRPDVRGERWDAARGLQCPIALVLRTPGQRGHAGITGDSRDPV